LVLVVTDGTGEAIDIGVLAPLALRALGLPVPAMVVTSVDVVLKSRTARLFNALLEADRVLYYSTVLLNLLTSKDTSQTCEISRK
jgi:hypothetical protein